MTLPIDIAKFAIDSITRDSPPWLIAQALQRAAVKRDDDAWWRWSNVINGFHLAVTARLATIPAFTPAPQDRGIVIVGGGRYLPSVYISIRVLRHLGCQLPIEVWHFDKENDSKIETFIRSYDVQFVNANEIANEHSFRFLDWHWWRGWQLKSFALLHSRFEEALLLDADCFPIRNPEYLFDWPEYREKGVVIWPDLYHSPTQASLETCRLFEIDWPDQRLAESGQFLVNRRECWQQLVLAGFYNEAADITYRYIWGDKDTFPFAWMRTRKPYARMWPECEADDGCLLQFDFNRHVIFQHRVGDKFKLGGSDFASTPQSATRNRFHGSLAHESFCFHALRELELMLQRD